MSWKTLHAAAIRIKPAIDWTLNALMWGLAWWLALVVLAVWWTW